MLVGVLRCRSESTLVLWFDAWPPAKVACSTFMACYIVVRVVFVFRFLSSLRLDFRIFAKPDREKQKWQERRLRLEFPFWSQAYAG